MENTYGEYVIQNLTETKDDAVERSGITSRNLLGLLPMFFLILLVVLRISWTLYRSFGQKTRSPQPSRMYVGARPRQSLGPQEPTIFVSPSNLPPPPKYEFMAPPSYEEVVGIHYPQYNAQPISQPISAALAQGTSTQPALSDNETSITVINEPRRTSLNVART